MNIKLVVVADDFGYCPNRNRAIVELFQKGAISETSLMVNATYSEHAAQMGGESGMPMGLHLNISEGRPIDDQCVTLLNDQDVFHGKMGIRLMLAENKVAAEDIEREMKAQIEKFKMLTGSYPHRVDGHQHVHVLPIIRNVFAKVLQEYAIPYTRLADEVTLDQAVWVAGSASFSAAVCRDSRQSRVVFKTHGIRFPAAFFGLSLMGHMTLENFIVTLPNADSVELMVHPGYPCTDEMGGCGEGPDDFSKSVDRLTEYNFLESAALNDYLKNHNIFLSTFREALP